MEHVDVLARRIAADAQRQFDPDKYQYAQYYEDSVEPWAPSAEQIAEHIRNQGWTTFDDFQFDHLKTEAERNLLAKAIQAGKDFLVASRTERGLALLVVAGPVEEDGNRTGYGCGKTMLARAVHYANAYATWTPTGNYLAVVQEGRFYEARALMGMFDGQEIYDPASLFRFGNMLIIDDVGREGALRWEKRDPDLQLQEKQNRYYNIIDHCYEKGINIVITSNMSARELAAFLGGAAWSRLLQMCPPQFRVNMTGLPDMRPVLGEQRADNWGF